MEKAKTLLLIVLVCASLVQTYFLAYSMPGLGAEVKTGQDYVSTEELGPSIDVRDALFPELIVLHLGQDRHTALYPDANFYEMIVEKLKGRTFTGFERDAAGSVDWERVRREDGGVELRFARPIPFELLRRVFKIDGDFLFSRDSIDRIWIFARSEREEVRTFFFSSDGVNVYESLRADLTIRDVEEFVGFGEYWTPYATENGAYYWPLEPADELQAQPLRYDALKLPFGRFTADQLQRSLFFDPGVTRTLPDERDGSQIYTDNKKILRVEQQGSWASYTDPIASSEAEDDLTENALSAVEFVNQHGGWNGEHGLTASPDGAVRGAAPLRFRQYYDGVPIVSDADFRFGYVDLALRQGVVAQYERTMLYLEEPVAGRTPGQLPAGQALVDRIRRAAAGMAVESLFPAYRTVMAEERIVLEPAWAIRLSNGQTVLVE